MSDLKLSVIVPTRDRPNRLRETLSGLTQQQDLDSRDYEVIVVDDGLVPASVNETANGPVAHLIRLGGAGRSAARNHGAGTAQGELLVFVDDDMKVSRTFLSSHLKAHRESPGALQVGSIRLPDTAVGTPFGRFRQSLENEGIPDHPGPLDPRRCTAQNMAIARRAFEEMGGFDPQLSAAEDQDLALRFAEGGGTVVYVPGAEAVHDDDGALDIRSYTRRAERYMEEFVGFGARHPDLIDTLERAAVNGPVRWGGEPIGLSAKKLLKSVLVWPPLHPAALGLVLVLERTAPDSQLLDRLYRLVLGAHLQRGYRRGLRSAGV